jgi:peptide/nickel transport system permease protein
MTGVSWRRRRVAAARFGRAYLAQPPGVAGAALLLVVLLVALAAPLVVPPEHLSVVDATGGVLDPPDAAFPLGTDENGLSVLALTLTGTRISLLVGVAAALLSVVIGTLVGMAAAHFGGWLSSVLLRLTDFFLVLPSLVLAIVLSTVLERGVLTIIVAIGVTAWPSTARLVRAQTLTIEARPFIERAQVLGGGHVHVLGRHVLPAVLPLVLASTTLAVGSAIVAESTLSFLGLGDPDPMRPSWGSMLRSAWLDSAVIAGAWWYLLPPGIAIGIVVLAFTMCGRALEAVLNPRLREG